MRVAPLLLALVLALAETAVPGGAETDAPAAPAPSLRVLPTGGLRAETAALLLSGQEGGLPLAVLALPVPGGSGGQTRVPVLVEADGPSLLAGHEEGPLRVEVCLYALGAGGGVLASLLDTVEIGPVGMAALARSGLKFQGELLLPPGETSLRILVRNPETKAVGLRRISLSVPSFHEGTPSVLPPLFAEAPGAWLAARAAEGEGTLPGPPGLPAARPVLPTEGEVTFQALVYRLGEGARLALEIRKKGSEKTTELAARSGERANAGAPELEQLAASVTLPGLEPGEYEVRLAIPGRAGQVRSPVLPVVVVSGGQGAGRTWAALGPGGAEGGGAAPAAGAQPKGTATKRHRFAAGPLRTAYREALRPLGSGDEPGARAAVFAFETTHLVTDREPLAPEDLIEVEAKVVGEMARRDPESLVSLLLLYDRLYHEALGRRAYLVATHDGELVFGLAEVYVRQSRSPAAKELAAGFLVDLARGQLGMSMGTFARRALSRALVYDPGNRAALLVLAEDSARRGDSHGAAGLLERLLKHHPDSLEGRLRLGLARVRLDQTAKARELLAEVVASAPPPEELWMLSLAYQELARLQLSGGDAAAARKTVEEGLKRLPGDDELLLEQAALFDRAGEHARAREALEHIQVSAAGESTSRHRYNQPPDGALDRAWEALEARVTQHLSALASPPRPGGNRP